MKKHKPKRVYLVRHTNGFYIRFFSFLFDVTNEAPLFSERMGFEKYRPLPRGYRWRLSYGKI